MKNKKSQISVYKKSLELHEKYGGKIETGLKVKINNKDDLSLAYSPGVAEVSRAIAKNPKQVFRYTIKSNTVAVVSDGSAILGLGNLGASAAIPVMEGKCALFKRFANVDAFPICLNTQDSEEIIKAVKSIAPIFGAINLEDIAAPRCFYIEERLRAEVDIPVMHDDQHGTAVVVLAGLINALKLKSGKKKINQLQKSQVKIVINGAGSAGLAIVDLLLKYGFKNIIVNDSQGIIFEGRSGLNNEKQKFAKLTNRENLQGDLAASLINADIFIGVSKARVLTQEMVRKMNPKPIIFALANPEPEIMPELAKEAGALVVATGRSDYPNQINNALAFPGIFRGALDNHIKQFNDQMFIKSAEVIAAAVKKVTADKIIPSPFEKGLAQKIAKVIK